VTEGQEIRPNLRRNRDIFVSVSNTYGRWTLAETRRCLVGPIRQGGKKRLEERQRGADGHAR
jgi:hypothetical protein